MIRHAPRREIGAPIDRVFHYVSDVTKQPEWVHLDLIDVQLDEPGPLRVGSKATQRLRFLGREQKVPITVVAYEPGRSIHFAKEQPFPIRFGFDLEAVGDKTVVSYPVEMSPTGFFRILIALMGPQKQIEADLASVQERLSE
jgi:uncharacterized membrane protein